MTTTVEPGRVKTCPEKPTFKAKTQGSLGPLQREESSVMEAQTHQAKESDGVGPWLMQDYSRAMQNAWQGTPLRDLSGVRLPRTQE